MKLQNLHTQRGQVVRESMEEMGWVSRAALLEPSLRTTKFPKSPFLTLLEIHTPFSLQWN